MGKRPALTCAVVMLSTVMLSTRVPAASGFAPSPLLLARRGGAAGAMRRLLFAFPRPLHVQRCATTTIKCGNAAEGTNRSFASAGLRPELLASLQRLGFGVMTDIQERALPAALSGRDIVGQGKTGSGKTAVFGLLLLQRLDLALDPRGGRPQAIVLSPTRELAEQLVTSIRTLASCMHGVRLLAVTGGQPSRDQRARLEAGMFVRACVFTHGPDRRHVHGWRPGPCACVCV